MEIENEGEMDEFEGQPEGQVEGEGGGEAQGEEAPATFLRDLTEDDVYDRLNTVHSLPNTMKSLESRVFGSMGPLTARLAALEKAQTTRASINPQALKGLEEYDPKLAEIIMRVLPEAINVGGLDESALRPYLEPVQNDLQNFVGSQLVAANYSKEELDEFIPDVVDGVFAQPTNQRQKDFLDWYAQQPYGMQQALTSLGAPYVRAIRSFEKWEQGKVQEREKAAKAKTTRLAGGVQASANGRRAAAQGPQTEDEAFEAGFNEVFKQRKG